MKMHTHPHAGLRAAACLAAMAVFGVVSIVSAEEKTKGPAGKIFVASVTGESQISHGGRLEDMNSKSAYLAEGTIIETKPKATNALVYSNGTGIFFDSDTRVEVEKFHQDPFVPNRSDLEVEPSVSQTNVLVVRGAVGLCTSKMVAGSSMTYRTPLGIVSTQGAKLVIETSPDGTTISMLDGESLVRNGQMDIGGKTLHSGEQAIIKAASGNVPASMVISQIPPAKRPALDERIFMACAARKTVFFDTSGPQGQGEIKATPVVPVSLPVPVTVSPSQLPP